MEKKSTSTKKVSIVPILLLLILLISWLYAFDDAIIKVGLNRIKDSKNLLLSLDSGGEVYIDFKQILKVQKIIQISINSRLLKNILVKTVCEGKENKYYGKELLIIPNTDTLVENPKEKIKQYYEGELVINNNGNTLYVINSICIKNYLESVVAGEMEFNAPIEALKAQAVVSRTFLLKNLSKHNVSGYNVCDSRLACCQVYKGNRFYDKKFMKEIIKYTKDQILLYNNEVIDALFSCCCGGRTCGVEAVWQEKTALEYLKPVEDKDDRGNYYCVKDPRFKWQCEFKLNILKKPFGKFLDFNNEMNIIKNDKGDVLYFVLGKDKLTVLEYRKRLGFLGYKGINSNFFDMEKKGDNYIFKGGGFGHRIGMCQSGACEMARVWKKYTEILTHYYKDVKIEIRR